MNDVAHKLQFQENDWEKWYSVKMATVASEGGSGLLSLYGRSLFALLSAVYPEYRFDPFKFPKVPRKFWQSKENQLRFLEEAGKKLGIQEGDLEAWHGVPHRKIIDLGGRSLLAQYNYSSLSLFSSLFPDFNWDPIKFGKVPNNYWASRENQRSLMEDIRSKLGIQEGDYVAWYKVSNKKIANNGGAGILNHFDGSLCRLLQQVYPEFAWDSLGFTKVPRHHWASLTNQRAFMETLGEKFGINSKAENDRAHELEKWYQVTKQQVIEEGGGGLLAKYQNSISRLLQSVFPEMLWDPARFAKAPNKHWSSPAHQKQFLEDLARKLGFEPSALEKWYQVPTSAVIENGGAGILSLYGNSLSNVLRECYPEFHWEPLRFNKAPKSYWVSLQNQIAFMDSLGEELRRLPEFALSDPNSSKLDIWYKVPNKTIIAHGGAGLLQHYKQSRSALLKAIYPSHPWDLSRFSKVPQNHWDSIANQRAFMESMGKKLGINHEEQWYHVSNQTVIDNGGGGLLGEYGQSLSDLLQTVFPNYLWQVWRFPGKSIRKLLSDEKTLKDMISFVEKELGLKTVADWQRLSRGQLETLGLPVGILISNRSSNFKKSRGETYGDESNLRGTLLKALKEHYSKETS